MDSLHTPVQTQDGTWTCFNADIGEHYHNMSGARAEAESLYVANTPWALLGEASKNVTILDPYFGLGYNSLSALSEYETKWRIAFPDSTITLVMFENDPEILYQIPSVLQRLDRDDLNRIWTTLEHKIYYQTHERDRLRDSFWAEQPENGLRFAGWIGDVRQLIKLVPDQSVDVIYHDAFSPRRQPELWTLQLFAEYRRVLKPGPTGILTYTASAPVRRGLEMTGFNVYPLVGAAKKPGTGASLTMPDNAVPFAEVERALMDSRSGLPYEDNPLLNASREEIFAGREARIAVSTLTSSSAVHRQYGYISKY